MHKRFRINRFSMVDRNAITLVRQIRVLLMKDLPPEMLVVLIMVILFPLQAINTLRTDSKNSPKYPFSDVK
jgi:hypothetical protein